ncbi:hypothetical protein [Pseudonocardia sp. H11422]|uniref:hypothetical protein n=1 Tax=Pseudonocardia sp. H11422 TaxID=2835866 RepID=UPI001BDC70CF|nr:hypothetical protein [Pseudonocardia sp. H11422]
MDPDALDAVDPATVQAHAAQVLDAALAVVEQVPAEQAGQPHRLRAGPCLRCPTT